MRMLKITWIFFPVFLLVYTGCEPQPVVTEPKSLAISDCNELSAYALYAPVKANILPLTEFVAPPADAEGSKITAYVSLSDSFGCQAKSPAVFRFELYEAVPRSAEPKGRRIKIWRPDIDLTDPAENHKHWRDFLRAYEFDLYLESVVEAKCILQVTCFCPTGRRLSADFAL